MFHYVAYMAIFSETLHTDTLVNPVCVSVFISFIDEIKGRMNTTLSKRMFDVVTKEKWKIFSLWFFFVALCIHVLNRSFSIELLGHVQLEFRSIEFAGVSENHFIPCVFQRFSSHFLVCISTTQMRWDEKCIQQQQQNVFHMTFRRKNLYESFC